MSAIDVMTEACATTSTVVRRAAGTDLTLPTPCRDFDLRALANHVTGTSAAMARIGARQQLDPDDPWGSSADPAAGEWATLLATNLQAVSAAWSQPQAWEGTVETSGTPMPASMLGQMALIEVMLHGWDIAAATGQPVEVSPALAAELRACVEQTAELGRQMEAYGPAVPLPPGAGDFDRALAAAGRDPAWRP